MSRSGDESIITEIVEHQDVEDSAVGSFYLADLAQVNGADGPGQSSLESVEELAHAAAPSLLADARPQAAGAKLFLVRGKQRVAKFKELARNEVAIRMLIARLPAVGSDVLVTINAPVWISPDSSSAKSLEDSSATVAGSSAGDAAAVPVSAEDAPSAGGAAGGAGAAAGGAGGPSAVAAGLSGAGAAAAASAASATPPPFGGMPLDDLARAIAASLKVVDYGLFETGDGDDVDE